MSTLQSPEPRLPSPRPLPPTTRDFEIHRLSLVEFLSTRRIAEKFEISQTRVRQVVDRVAEWLTEMLPSPTEADQEKQKRYAIHLAAAQLQNQIELLHSIWTGTADPKYLRQQTRAILALARLGVPAGKLDALAAAAEEVQSPPPPPGDCSPLSHASHPDPLPTDNASAATSSEETTSADEAASLELDLQGLNLIERRLLTLLEQASPADTDRMRSLQNTLTTVRRQQAVIELQLSPNIQGANLQTQAPPVNSSPAGSNDRMEQKQTEATEGCK